MKEFVSVLPIAIYLKWLFEDLNCICVMVNIQRDLLCNQGYTFFHCSYKNNYANSFNTAYYLDFFCNIFKNNSLQYIMMS